MTENPYIKLILFYSNFNPESIRSRIAIWELVDRYARLSKIVLEEVNYDVADPTQKLYKVNGTPVLIILRDQKIIRRYLGKVEVEEMEQIMDNLFKR
ncbi:MAG: hypothetical protein GWN16_08810 [Calditrichae bacterium]|nr:hypothetical protein [Calditrichia bacterium]